MQNLIAAYLQDMELAWAPTTSRCRALLLRSLLGVLDGNPASLWAELSRRGMKPYSRVTTWAAVTAFWQWLLDNSHMAGENPYAAFRRKNARQFKDKYVRQTCKLSYEEMLRRIESIPHPGARAYLVELLRGGLRVSELPTLENGWVTGKGGKRREVFASRPEVDLDVSYRTLLRHAKAVGFKTHDCRKVFLTTLAEEGAPLFELMEAAGWADPGSARSYINVNRDSLKKRVRSIHGRKDRRTAA